MTPLAKEVLENLVKFPHCILLTRVGQFYESYFSQAAEVARILNIKLTSKRWGGERVPMCGFPLMHLNKYLKILVQDNSRFVAMCEEFMRSRVLGPKAGFDRRVTRIVTPGTLIDEPFLNQYENNYLLSLFTPSSADREDSAIQERPIGLAWIDVSTGEFFAKGIALSNLRDELVRIRPKEVVLEQSIFHDPAHPVRQIVAEERFFVSSICQPAQSQDDILFAEHAGADDLTSEMESLTPAFKIALTQEESQAVQLLTAFLHANLLEHMPRLPSPSKEASAGRMQIDAHTIKSLELRETMREGGTAGSLLSSIKRTVTNGGTRLLARWLSSPSVSLREVNSRQSLVAFFYARPHLRQDLTGMLSELEDSTRVVQKLLLGRGDHTDLSAINASVKAWASIKRRLELEKRMEVQEKGPLREGDWASLDALVEKLQGLQALSNRIELALSRSGSASPSRTSDDSSPDDPEIVDLESAPEPVEEAFPAVPAFKPNFVTSFIWIVRPEFSDKLMSLHNALNDCLDRQVRLEQQLQSKYEAPSLTLRSSPGFGMHVHIGRNKRDGAKIMEDKHFVPISQSASTCSFFYQEWSLLGAQIVQITSEIQICEREAFEILREEVNQHEADIRRNARITDELDVTMAFASLAEEMRFIRPVLHEDKSYHVVNGRHPTVELGLLAAGRTFVPNTVTFTADGPLHVITGPNMAGKSTLLRQTALIAILAQTGSFVPADAAELGIVDAIFSRVGANDDLFRNRSTFMVEMMETADILRRATPNSLVIMDEVGRGTSVQDGLAIAFATIHHLVSVNKSRALFATHFHELADMLGCLDGERGQGAFSGVKFFYTDVDETEDGYFAYSHRLKSGVNRDSHGLKVAELAGMPASAVSVARAALRSFRDPTTGILTRDSVKLRSLGQTLIEDSEVSR
ncbi:MutS family DNA mismatch repair protein [Phanerochaete sordida]|uniref:MutS family DNA mismatch repair protein n=1 Tax=Phanerochaete sordida TaxID=48140 RepID=A0A9P3FZ87_9APHY|nr:MutS family DNA mismatch repair protein [Phanerochaete sordida]